MLLAMLNEGRNVQATRGQNMSLVDEASLDSYNNAYL